MPVMLLERMKSSQTTLQHGRCIHQTREKCDWVTVVELLKFYDDGNAGTERHHHLPSSEMRNFFVPFRKDHYFPFGNNRTDYC